MNPIDLLKLQVKGIDANIQNYQEPPEEEIPFVEYRGMLIDPEEYIALEDIVSHINKTLDDLWSDDKDATKFKVYDNRITYLQLRDKLAEKENSYFDFTKERSEGGFKKLVDMIFK